MLNKWKELAQKRYPDAVEKAADFDFIRAKILTYKHQDKQAAEIYRKILVTPQGKTFVVQTSNFEAMHDYSMLLKAQGDEANAKIWFDKWQDWHDHKMVR
jgi:hypothetical protein